MEEISRDFEHLSPNWAEVIRHYTEMRDEIMPYLSAAEQVVYQRLFRLSHALGIDYVTCRYHDLADQCGHSLSTLQRVVKGCKRKKFLENHFL